MKITMDGKYQTDMGRPVRILAVDRKNEQGYCVVGLTMHFSGNEEVECWKADGTSGNTAGSCLVPLPVQHTAWAIVDQCGHILRLFGETDDDRLKAQVSADVFIGQRVVPVRWVM
jgi:hypothetical protein